MSGSDGFTLLESLVAIAIVGVSMTTVLGIAGSSQTRIQTQAAEFRSLVAAKTLLIRFGLDRPYPHADETGLLSDGSRYRISVRPFVGPLPEGATERRPRLVLRTILLEVTAPGSVRGAATEAILAVPLADVAP